LLRSSELELPPSHSLSLVLSTQTATMRFSSFIMITAAGLAVAAPISPYASDDMSLTVEPTEVAKRQNLQAFDTIKDTIPSLGTRGLPGLDSLLPGGSDDTEKEVEPKEPKEPKEPSSIAEGNKTEAATTADSGVTGTGILRRQLPDINALLAGASDVAPAAEDTAAADDEETVDEDDEEVDEDDEKEVDEDEDDEQDDEDEDEDDDEEKKKADKKKADKKKAEKKEAKEKKEKDEKKKKEDEEKDDEEEDEDAEDDDDDAEAEDEDVDDEDSEEKEPEPAPAKGGLMGTGILARQSSSSKTVETASDAEDAESSIPILGGLTGGLRKRQPIDVATLTGLSGDSSDAAEDTASGLAGLRKRQLNGLLGDKPATPDGDGDDSTQTLASDDGTNGENSFDAQEDAAADAAADSEAADADAEPEKDTEAEKKPGVLGGLGL